MLRVQARRLFAYAGAIAVLGVAAWAMLAPVASMPPVLPAGDQPVYTPTDPPALPLLEPVLHAPWLGTPPRLLAWLAPLAIALGAAGMTIFAGASPLASLFLVLTLLLDSSFGAAVAHASGLALAVGLLWLAAGAAFDELPRPKPVPAWVKPLAAILLWASAVWCHWLAIAGWPVVFAALRRTPERPGRGVWTAASLAVGAIAFAAHFVWVAAAARALSADPAPAISWADALAVGFDARPRMPAGSFVAPDISTRMTSLGLVLIVVGVVFGGLPRWWRRTVVLCGALVAAIALGWPAWQSEAVRFAVWAVMPLGAVGLTWIARQTARTSLRPLVTCLLGAVLLGETIARGARPLEGQEARLFRDALAATLAARGPEDALTVFVAEDTRIDSALAAWASTNAGATRMPQDAALVAAAVGQGRRVLAGPTGRRHLELDGVVFGEAVVVDRPLPFVFSRALARLTCVEIRADRWSLLPGVEYTGRLGLRVPAGLSGGLDLVIGDTLPLRIRAEGADRRPLPMAEDRLLSGPGSAAPPADYWLDGGAPGEGPDHIKRVRLPARPSGVTLAALHLGRRAPRVLARLSEMSNAARGRVCAAPMATVTLPAEGDAAVQLPVSGDEGFGTGWYGREGSEDRPFRWADSDAVVLINSIPRVAVRVALDAAPAVNPARPEPSAPTVTLSVNGVEISAHALGDGERRYEWRVPAGIWLAGTNELRWHTSHATRPSDDGGEDRRRLALQVTRIAVTRATR